MYRVPDLNTLTILHWASPHLSQRVSRAGGRLGRIAVLSFSLGVVSGMFALSKHFAPRSALEPGPVSDGEPGFPSLLQATGVPSHPARCCVSRMERD